MTIHAKQCMPSIISLNISEETGTIKTPRESVEVNELGIVGDAHAGVWHRQVSLLGKEDIDRFSAEEASGKIFAPGEFAENITTVGIDLAKVAVLDRFKAGTVELEVTQIGKKCHGTGCAIFVEVGKCVMPQAGIFTRVVRGGTLYTGDAIEFLPRAFKIRIITLSDRASSGIYKDESGPALRTALEAHFAGKRWHPAYTSVLLPDDKERLQHELRRAVDEQVDVVFTTGGTGIGPRDWTPDVVASFSDRQIPGIMEHIRQKYGDALPSALLSRSVAAVKNQTLIYTLPGSVKAVQEYTKEIARTLEHAFLMLHGVGH
jgi:molybdenum cofactor synthesis domain-containing protein